MQRHRGWHCLRISSSLILRVRASPYSTAQTTSTRRTAAPTIADGPTDMGRPEHLFHYTSGRWLYNEQQRVKERERVFNVNELKRLAAEAVSRKVEDVVSFDKLGEGGANRAFVLHMKGGSRLVARIPYAGTVPRQLAVASEAATMSFLRSQGVPVPQIHDYSTSADNPAGTEYIIMEYSPGTNLSDSWVEMNEQDRSNFITSLVALEARSFNIRLPANGSIYFLRDLPANVDRVSIDDDDSQSLDFFYTGPSTSPSLWRRRRGGLDVNRGPFIETEAVLTAGAKKKIAYLEHLGRPLLPYDRIRRETFQLEKQLPSVHLDSLRKYLTVASYLVQADQHQRQKPTLRHFDLRPSNVFVSDQYEITSLINWQHSTILPLFLQAGIPDYLNNSSDLISQSLETPKLPQKFHELGEDQRTEQRELFRARQLHYSYVAETAKQSPAHFAALIYPHSMVRRRLYRLSSDPWAGDNIPLRSSLIILAQRWHEIVTDPTIPCPIHFAAEDARECLALDESEREAEEQMRASMEMLGIGPEGWVPCGHYAAANEATPRMKSDCLELAETELERKAVNEYWVYDDMDEDEYW